MSSNSNSDHQDRRNRIITVLLIVLIIAVICAIIKSTPIPNGLETDLKVKQDSVMLLKKQNDSLQKDVQRLKMLAEKLYQTIKEKKKYIMIIDTIYNDKANSIRHLNLDQSIELLSKRLSEKSDN